MAIEFTNANSFGTLMASANMTICMNTTDVDSLCSFGTFNQSLSSSFSFKDWNPDPAYFEGPAFADDLEFAGASLPNFNMSLVYNYTSDTSNLLPAVYLISNSDKSAGLVEYMEAAGHSATRAFSLWLQEGDDYAGGLLFGAIDTNRYDGDLVSLEAYTESQTNDQPWENGGEMNAVYIIMTSLSASSSTGTDDIWAQQPSPIRFNMGSVMTLPTSVVAQVRNITGAFETRDGRYTVVPCSMRDSEGYFTFGFGGSEALKLNVSMRSLVTPPPSELQAYFDSIEKDLCQFAIYDSGIIGGGSLAAPLLRSAYTVVDLYNNKVAMAPIKLDAKDDESNIVVFSGKSAPIPSATLAPSQPSVTSSTSDAGSPLPTSWRAVEGFKILTTTTTSATALLPSSSLSSPPSPSGTNSPGILAGSLSTGAKAGVGVGVSIAAALLATGAFLARRRWKRKRDLKNKLLIEQQLLSEKPELHGTPMDIYEARGLRDGSGNPVVGEMPSYSEAAELYVQERCVELPAEPVVVRGGGKGRGPLEKSLPPDRM